MVRSNATIDKGERAIMNTETTRLSVCGLCGSKCFVDLTVSDGKIIHTDKAQGHPHIKGDICLRGAALKQYLGHPDRIRHPLLRTGEKGSGQFQRISWEEAFALIGAHLTAAKETDGARSAVFYSGNPKWYRYMLAELARDYGSPNFCTESSTCHTARWIAHKLCYGVDAPQPDMKACKTLLCWGANPAYSRFMQTNGVLGVAERGDNLIVVDPRCTPVSERAALHLRPWYGTDCALAMGLANVILSEGLEDKAFLEQYAHGYTEYAKAVAEYTPERTERLTGVPSEQIVRAGRMIGRDVPLSIYTSSSGIAHSPNSVQAYRAIYLLEALTGSYDNPGGNHGPAGPAAKLGGFHHAAGPRVNPEEEFVQNRFPLWNDLIPNEGQVMGLDRAILTGEPYPIRNLIAFGMNFRMFPQSERMRQALLAAEFYVDVDLFMTDSAKCADLVLPCQADPEKESVHILQDGRLFYLPNPLDAGDCRNDVEIMQGICTALDLHGPLTGMRSYDEYLGWTLAPTGVTLSELKEHPEGMQPKQLREGKLRGYEQGLSTPSGKVEFTSTVMERYAHIPGCSVLPEFQAPAELNPDPEKYPLTLCVGAKRPQFFHSRTYRLPWLANLEPHTVANVSPATAQRLGLKDGQAVKVTSPVAERIYRLEVDTGLLDGVVHLCHDDEGDQNGNDLIDAEYGDPISGFPGFRCYFCGITPLEVKE